MSRLDSLMEKGLIQPPKFLKSNVHYECMTGSVAMDVQTIHLIWIFMDFVCLLKKLYSSHFSII